MKYRKDFVTNSSSSSYTCEICGRTESGWDMGLREAEMVECVNGHVFCQDEMFPIGEKEELIKTILENEWNKDRYCSKTNSYRDFNEEELQGMSAEDLFDMLCSDGGNYGVPESVCPICQFIEYSEYDLSNYLEREYHVSRDEVFAEVKKVNRRRKKLYENEYITYVCNKFNLNPAEIVASWKERFGTYAEFEKYKEGK